MLKWIHQGRIVGPKGTTNYYYTHDGWEIEARQTYIPRANGEGCWKKTFFWVLKDGKELKMFYSLADAKDYAEKETTK